MSGARVLAIADGVRSTPDGVMVIALELRRRLFAGEIERLDYRPAPGARLMRCHDNVIAHVAEHPDHRPYYGWWLNGSGTTFAPHSVVQLPSGRLVDITPRTPDRDPTLVFIKHPGAAHSFRSLAGGAPRKWPVAKPRQQLIARRDDAPGPSMDLDPRWSATFAPQ